MKDVSTALRAIGSLSASVLIGGHPDLERSRPTSLDGYETVDLRRLAAEHRVSGLVLSAIDSDRATDVPTELRTQLSIDHLTQLNQSLLAEASLVRVARRLASADIEMRVIKGLATAHLDHADPSCRATSDVDVLVRPDQLDRATDALADMVDWAGSIPDRRPRFVARHGKDRTLLLSMGGWLDLHRMIAPSYWGFALDHQRLFDNADRYSLAGTELCALPRSLRFVHAVIHTGVSDDLKLQSLLDVLLLAAHLDDPVAALNDPALSRTRGVLARGLDRVSSIVDLPAPLRDWASSIDVSRAERLALRSTRLDGSRSHWAGPLALPVWQWPGYLTAIVAPSQEYLDWYDRTPGGHLRSAHRALRRRNDS